MFQLLNLVLLKHFTRSKCFIFNNYVDHLSFYVFFSVITYVSKEIVLDIVLEQYAHKVDN